MGKFCTKCGRPLAVGEVCACQSGKPTGALGVANSRAYGAQQPNVANGQAYGAQQVNATNGQVYGVQQPNAGNGQAYGAQQINATNSQYYGAQQTNMANGQPYSAQQQYEYQQQVQQAQQQYQQMQQAASNLFSKAVGTYINLLKSPVEYGRKLATFADWGVIILLVAFQALMTGFFDLAVMARISGMSSYIRMPYAKSFLVTVIASGLLSFALAAMLFAGNLIIKNKVAYRQMLACAAVRSALLTVTTLISILLIVIFPPAGLFLFYAASLWGLVAIVLIMPQNTPGGREDGFALMHFLVAFLFLILFIVVASACSIALIPSSGLFGGLGSLSNLLEYYF